MGVPRLGGKPLLCANEGAEAFRMPWSGLVWLFLTPGAWPLTTDF
jgi:hypothetical protein